MTARRQREIVVEFEKVQMIRKRAKTMLMHCDNCKTVSDAVLVNNAAELFETSPDNLDRFIQQNDCHYQVTYDDKKLLCITSLLNQMKQQNKIRLDLPKGD